MASSRVDIRDVGMLDELTREFERSSSQMSHIDADVRNHLDSVMADLQRQLDYIDGRLHNAEHRLSCAEAALSACQASAQAAAALGMCQTCVCEEQEVSMARMEVEKWRTRFSQGQQIVAQCRQETSDYNCGAHQLVERMCNEHMPQATRQLNDHIDKLQDILNITMADMSTTGDSQAVTHKKEAKTANNDSCFADFRKNIRGVKEDTVSQSHNQSDSLLRPTHFV